jgi:signal transduction histidine kinase
MVTRAGTSASATGGSKGSAGKARGPSGDRRSQSERAAGRRRAAEDALLDVVLNPNDASADSVGAAGQTLLMKALRRLERQEDIQSTVAWALESDGRPIVMAAHPADSAQRIPPTLELYRALATLDRVQRLTDSGLSAELTELGTQGVAAAAPIPGPGAMPAAVLLVFPRKPGRSIRPRSIAVLGEVAAKLTHTLSTSMALDRMSRLDDSVRRLDRLATLGGLVSEIVHEIRNPLVSVKTFLQLLPERLDDPEFHHDFRGVVSDEVARLERMLDDLLRHARPSVAAPVDGEARIDEAIETTLQLLTYRCRERGVALETKIHSGLPALGLPEDALRQLLLNLLLNATQVTPEGSQILVSANWSAATANHVELCVEDEGPGLDAGLRQRIFEPFWTTRNEGAGGLGLAICKRIVEEAGGSIGVTDRRNGGACFRIELPIAR